MAISVAWRPDANLLASGDVEGTIRLWAIDKTEPPYCMQVLTRHTQFVAGLAFASDGTMLASASSDGTVKVWDTRGGELLETLTRHMELMHRVVWSSDGRILASAGFEKTIWLWDVEQRRYRTTPQ